MTALFTAAKPATTGRPKFVKRTPGVPGCAARFIANHINQALGSTVSTLPSVEGSAGMVLAKLGAGASTITLGEENGIKHLYSPGDALNGGRLLSTHINTRPITIAAVVKMGAGVESFIGATGVNLTRNTAGVYGATNGAASSYTATNQGTWTFVLLAMDGSNSFISRADGNESSAAVGSAAVGSNGGFYLGASAAGDACYIREAIYWPSYLPLADRDAVHEYFRSRYPELA